MSIVPYLIGVAAACIPLLFVATRSRRHALALLAMSPLLLAMAAVVFGFFWTTSQVQGCVDCSSSFRVFNLDVFTTDRVDGGFAAGSLVGSAVTLAIGLAVAVGFGVFVHRRTVGLSSDSVELTSELRPEQIGRTR